MSFESMVDRGPLGQGASLRLVENPATGQAIAVRSINIRDGDVFLQEVERLVDLAHPCVLKVIGYSLPTTRTTAKLGTEYAPNGSLRDALEAKRSGEIPEFLDETGVAIIVCGIVLGMRFIHSRGAVHRDLKPANILIDAWGFAKIGDLGSARFLDAGATQKTGGGTHYYMAPEMYEDADCTAAVDVFAFALILYELLVGEFVFPPTLSEVVIRKQVIEGTRAELPPGMNPLAKDIIGRGWGFNPSTRPSFNEIWDKLRGIRFSLTPAVDVARVEAFVAWVRRYETN
jgi:serine/threonine protein kinase